VVPVLERGLEKAVTLAESLDSRGFAHGGTTARERGAGWAGVASLVALGSAFVALVAHEDSLALVLGSVGVLALLATVQVASRATGRIRYRPRRMTAADRVCIAGSLLAPILLAALIIAGDDTLTWTPSPVAWPAFGVLPALAFVPLLAPLSRRPSLPTPVPVAHRPAPGITAEVSPA